MPDNCDVRGNMSRTRASLRSVYNSQYAISKRQHRSIPRTFSKRTFQGWHYHILFTGSHHSFPGIRRLIRPAFRYSHRKCGQQLCKRRPNHNYTRSQHRHTRNYPNSTPFTETSPEVPPPKERGFLVTGESTRSTCVHTFIYKPNKSVSPPFAQQFDFPKDLLNLQITETGNDAEDIYPDSLITDILSSQVPSTDETPRYRANPENIPRYLP